MPTILPSPSTRAIFLTYLAIYSCIPLKAIQYYIIIRRKFLKSLWNKKSLWQAQRLNNAPFSCERTDISHSSVVVRERSVSEGEIVPTDEFTPPQFTSNVVDALAIVLPRCSWDETDQEEDKAVKEAVAWSGPGFDLRRPRFQMDFFKSVRVSIQRNAQWSFAEWNLIICLNLQELWTVISVHLTWLWILTLVIAKTCLKQMTAITEIYSANNSSCSEFFFDVIFSLTMNMFRVRAS